MLELRAWGLARPAQVVQAAGETLYTIGVTQRAVEERVTEIAQELRPVAGDVTIRVLDAWPQRGNVELYFKYRYHAEQHKLGSLTEYFAFTDVRPVLQDLRRMPINGLTSLEQAVLADAPTAIERALAAEAEVWAREQKARERLAAIAAGMAQARQRGIHWAGQRERSTPRRFWRRRRVSGCWPRSAAIRGCRFGRRLRLLGCRSIPCRTWPQSWGMYSADTDNLYSQKPYLKIGINP